MTLLKDANIVKCYINNVKTTDNVNFDDFLYQLSQRSFIHLEKVIKPDDAQQLVNCRNASCYLGIDPTKDSLHVGHLFPLYTLFELGIKYNLQVHLPFIIQVIIVLGGFTAMIGDPSGINVNRAPVSFQDVEKNIACIKEQVKNIIEKFHHPIQYTILNNADWLNNYKLRDILKFLDIIKYRHFLNKKFPIISTSQAIYPLLQALDFLHLVNNFNCIVTVGGFDQIRNFRFMHYILRNTPNITTNAQHSLIYIPVQLLKCKSLKMSKSNKNTVWLNSQLTPIYEFWNFWRNLDDEACIRYSNI